MTYPVEKLPKGWETSEVVFRHANGAESSPRYEIIHIETQNRYLHEPMRTTACKCLALFLVGLPLYFLTYTAYQLIRTPIVSLVHLSPTAFLNQIWAIARIPLYFIGLEFAALYGIFYPIAARALFAEVESQFHDGKGLHQSIQYQKEISCKSCCCNSLIDRDYSFAWFAGVCMQPIGKTTDPHIISVRRALPAA